MVNSSISAPSWLDAMQVQRYDRLRDARPSATLTLGEALDAIVDGTYADRIVHLRSLREVCWPDAYREAKQRLPAFTFAGTFAPTRARAIFSATLALSMSIWITWRPCKKPSCA